jgi:acetyl esterase/lipase
MSGLTRREIASGAAVLAATILLGQGTAITAVPAGIPAIDPLSVVDPELRPMARNLLAMTANAPPLAQSYSSMRQSGGPPLLPPLPDIPVASHRIQVGNGRPDVTIYVINATEGSARPAILHTHGGGYVLGSAKTEIRLKQEIAKELDCVIVTVDYRLAPEARYTASIEENYAGLKWLHDNAATLGVDRARIAVMGESAGGGHAALLALTARERGQVPLLLQVLIYPMLDDRTGSTRMPPPYIGRIGWDAPANRVGWRSFLGQEPGGAHVPAAAVPARARSLAGLPPAFIGVGAIDLFVEEDIAYGARLIEAGVATELLVVPGAFHGFDGAAANTSVARRFTAAKIDALRRAFASARA